MKNITKYLSTLLSIALMSLTLSACDGVSGNGNVITKEIEVDPFSKIELKGMLNIYLNQGDKEMVKVEADENLIGYVEVLQDGDKLILKTKDKIGIKKSTKMNVYVTIKDLRHLNVAGVGNVTSKPLQLNEIKVDVTGVGNTELELYCKRAELDIAAVGNVTLRGKAVEAVIEASGTGNLRAMDFETGTLDIEVSGIGNAEVRAEKEIKIESNGIGNLTYAGSAIETEKKVSGIGKVKRKDS